MFGYKFYKIFFKLALEHSLCNRLDKFVVQKSQFLLTPSEEVPPKSLVYGSQGVLFGESTAIFKSTSVDPP